MEPKTGKRIVSKGEYMQTKGEQVIFFVIVWSCRFLPFVLAGNLAVCFITNKRVEVVIYGVLCYCCVRLGIVADKQAEKIKPGIPLTRANTADLPAPDSLVRASSEPLQAQEAVLLRAAQGIETPPEQLLRASVGME